MTKRAGGNTHYVSAARFEIEHSKNIKKRKYNYSTQQRAAEATSTAGNFTFSSTRKATKSLCNLSFFVRTGILAGRPACDKCFDLPSAMQRHHAFEPLGIAHYRHCIAKMLQRVVLQILRTTTSRWYLKTCRIEVKFFLL